ncbi:MAG: radical SAM family heme chaperone HemW [Deinococcus sp.]|nr:radical SAM family heme chaperone HemW [Deinococcus sp.]
MATSGPSAIYIHVPFCPSICPYCAFHVVVYRAQLVDRYLAALEQEIAHYQGVYPDLVVETVFFGGGTPSMLRTEPLARIMSQLRHWRWPENVEVSLEANPVTISLETARELRQMGITRLSLGVQSFSDTVLRFLGRQHDAATARQAFQCFRDAGLVMSLDLMSAVPGQDIDTDLRAALELEPDHISVYTLTPEERTPFANLKIDPDAEAYAFLRTNTLLPQAGYEHYEVSNFARPGRCCRHNLAYWENRLWLGLGPAAAGHLAGQRRINYRLRQYLAAWEESRQWYDDIPLTPQDRLKESMIMGLRLREGVDLERVQQFSGLDPRQVYQREIANLVAAELVELVGKRLRLTERGLWVANRVAQEFV